jgi:ABC-type proline/glycine betaine transport system permease subunit
MAPCIVITIPRVAIITVATPLCIIITPCIWTHPNCVIVITIAGSLTGSQERRHDRYTGGPWALCCTAAAVVLLLVAVLPVVGSTFPVNCGTVSIRHADVPGGIGGSSSNGIWGCCCS